jgi:hypothetical protein
MSIASFSDLKTQIASWVNRTDLTDAQLALFIGAAESDIRNDVRVRDSEQSATGSVSSGTFAAPSDFLYARVVTVDDHVLNYLAPSYYLEKVDEEYTEGYYTIEGDTFKVLGGSTYVLKYVAQIAALSSTNTSNWILANAPNVYLWAACKYASVFLRDPEGATGFNAMYRDAVLQLNKTETRALTGDNLVIRVA